MRLIFLSIILFPTYLFCQTKYDATQDKKITTATSDISSLKTSITSIKTANTGQDTKLTNVLSVNNTQATTITQQQTQIKALQDSIAKLRMYLSSDFKVDTKGNITIPQLKTLSDRISKLEGVKAKKKK